MKGASEAFLASTTREIQAVASIDDVALPAAPGPRTREAQEAFAAPATPSSQPPERIQTANRKPRGRDGLQPQRRAEADRRDARASSPTARSSRGVRENDRAERFDRELARKLGEVGFLGPILDEDYGGRDLDYIGYGLIVEADRPRRLLRPHRRLGAAPRWSRPIEHWGTEEQKQRWLPRLCSGEALGCFGLTEPDTGSDAANLRTRATKTDSGWSISGQKMWISLGNAAEVALIFAQTDPAKKHKGLAAFLVPTDSQGFTSAEIHGKLGLRSSDTAELSLDAVEVGDDALLGEVGDGFKVAMTALDAGRYSVAAGCVGIMDGCVEASVAYAKERQQFGVPLARFQLVQEMIADMILKRDAVADAGPPRRHC